MSIRNNNQNGSFEPDMFDVTGFLRFFVEALRLNKLLILFIVLICLGAAVWYQRTWPPIYRATAQLEAERGLDSSRDPFYAGWQVFRKGDARDEIKLFTAGPVLREVIEKNHLTYKDVYHPFLSHAAYMWEKSWLGRKYTALKSKFSSEPEPPADEEEKGLVLEGLKAGVEIGVEGDSDIATATFSGPSPKVAEIGNSVVNSFLQYRNKRHAEEARSAYAVLTQESIRARAELAQVEQRREAFAHQNGLLMDLQKETQDVRQMTDVETSVAAHKTKISALEGSIADIDRRLKEEAPEKVLNSVKAVNNVREQARMKRLDLETSLIGLRDKYREDSPEVQEVLADMAKLDALIAKEPEYIDASVTRGVNTLHQQLASNRLELLSNLEGERSALVAQEALASQMRQRLEQLPQVTTSYVDLQRDYDIAKDKYQQLLFKRMEADVSAAAIENAPASVRVIDYAAPPLTKYWPRSKYLYPGALAVGLLLGALAALIRSLTAGRLLRSDVERGRLATPVYATIAVGGRTRSLTVLPRPSDPGESTNPPQQESGRSQTAGQ